jgi:L-alanine-DL-glutamate epimerase-like enolase superfamily enzyme
MPELTLQPPAVAITAIEAQLVRVPVEPPAAFATRLVRNREYVIVTVRDGDGCEGVGYAYAGDQGGALVAEAVRELIAPLLLGRPSWAVEENWAHCFQELLLIGRRGAVIRALSAVDIGCWDLRGKLAGESLQRLLGSDASEVPAYASGGYYRTEDHLGDMRSQVQHYLDLGFVDFKIKFGRLPLAQDIERVRLARELIGPQGRLALDINNAWRNLAQALPAVHALAELDVWWIEEPFAPDDLASHRALTERSPVPIATGEIEATRWGFAQLIEQRAAHVLQPDVCVVGGISEFMKIAYAAACFSLPIAPHWHANLHAPLVAASPSGEVVEYFDAALGIFNFEQLVSNPLVVEQGRIQLLDEPGIGVDFDEQALERWRVP